MRKIGENESTNLSSLQGLIFGKEFSNIRPDFYPFSHFEVDFLQNTNFSVVAVTEQCLIRICGFVWTIFPFVSPRQLLNRNSSVSSTAGSLLT